MSVIIRIEFLKLAPVGSPGGQETDQPQISFGAQEIVLTGSAQLSNVAPAFGTLNGNPITDGVARMSMISGAATVAWGDNTTVATEANGTRVEFGRPFDLPIKTGQYISVLQAADQPPTAGGGGGGGGVAETLWTDNSGAYYVRVDTAGVITWQTITGATSSAPGTGAKPAGGSGAGALAETLWTDDSGAYYVRVDTGTAITFVTPTGGAATTGTGLRPSGDVATVDRTSYSATAGGTGFSIGDLIDNVICVDRKTSAVVSNFWLNLTTGAVIAAPGSGNIQAVAANNGVQGTGSTYNPPAGGSGLLGYLSGIFKAITNSLTVSQLIGGAAISAANPMPIVNEIGGNPISATNQMPVYNPISILQYSDATRTKSAVATAYAANQYIGDATDSQFKFSSLFRVNGGTGYLNELRLFLSKAGGLTIPAGIVIRAMIYNASAAAVADYAAFNLTEALRSGEGRLGFVDFTTTYSGGASSDEFEMVAAPTWPMLLQAAAGAKDLYVVLIATGAWTPTASTVLNLRASVSPEQ